MFECLFYALRISHFKPLILFFADVLLFATITYVPATALTTLSSRTEIVRPVILNVSLAVTAPAPCSAAGGSAKTLSYLWARRQPAWLAVELISTSIRTFIARYCSYVSAS